MYKGVLTSYGSEPSTADANSWRRTELSTMLAAAQCGSTETYFSSENSTAPRYTIHPTVRSNTIRVVRRIPRYPLSTSSSRDCQLPGHGAATAPGGAISFQAMMAEVVERREESRESEGPRYPGRGHRGGARILIHPIARNGEFSGGRCNEL